MFALMQFGFYTLVRIEKLRQQKRPVGLVGGRVFQVKQVKQGHAGERGHAQAVGLGKSLGAYVVSVTQPRGNGASGIAAIRHAAPP